MALVNTNRNAFQNAMMIMNGLNGAIQTYNRMNGQVNSMTGTIRNGYNMGRDWMEGMRNTGVTRSGTRFRQIQPVDTDRRVRRRIEPTETPSTDPPISENTDEMTSHNSHDTHEVPIVPIPKRISKIAPDYFTVELPLHLNFDLDNGNTVESFQKIDFRSIVLNDINDPFGTSSNVAVRGMQFYKTYFQFYRVLFCNVKMTWFNRRTDITRTCAVGWHTSDDSTANGWNSIRDLFEMKQAKGDILMPLLQSGEDFITHVYKYDHRSWHHHVQTSGLEEKWTPIVGNPTNPRYLHFGNVTMDVGGTNVQPQTHVSVEAMFTVQFREVEDSILQTSSTTQT